MDWAQSYVAFLALTERGRGQFGLSWSVNELCAAIASGVRSGSALFRKMAEMWFFTVL